MMITSTHLKSFHKIIIPRLFQFYIFFLVCLNRIKNCSIYFPPKLVLLSLPCCISKMGRNMEALVSKLLIRRAFLWFNVSLLVIVVLSCVASYLWHWKSSLPLVFLAGTEILQFCQNFSGGDSHSNTSTISLNSVANAVLGLCVGILAYVFILTKFEDMHELMIVVLQFGCGLIAQFAMFREVDACQRLSASTDRLGLGPAVRASCSRSSGGRVLREGDLEEETLEEDTSLWRDVWVLVERRAREGLQRSVWVAVRMGLALTLLWVLLGATLLCAETFLDESSNPFTNHVFLELLASLTWVEIWWNVASLCLLCLVCYNAIADSFDVLMSYPMNMHKASLQLQLSGVSGQAGIDVVANAATGAAQSGDDQNARSQTIDYCPSVQLVMGILAACMPVSADDIKTLWTELQSTRAVGGAKLGAHMYSCHTVHSGRLLAGQMITFSDAIIMRCLRDSVALYRSKAAGTTSASFSWLDPFASLHMGASSTATSVYMHRLLAHNQQGMFSLLQYASVEDCVRVFSADTRVAQRKRSAFFADPQTFLHFFMNMITRIKMFTLHMDVLMQYCDSNNYAVYCTGGQSTANSDPLRAKRLEDTEDILLRKGGNRAQGLNQSIKSNDKVKRSTIDSTNAAAADNADVPITSVSAAAVRAQAIVDLTSAMYAFNTARHPAEFEGSVSSSNSIVYIARRFISSTGNALERGVLSVLLNNRLSKALPAVGAYDFSSTLVANASSNLATDITGKNIPTNRQGVSSGSGSAVNVGAGFNSMERSNKQVLFNRAAPVPVTGLHQSKNMMFSRAASAFSTSPKHMKMVGDALTIVTQTFIHSNDDESNAGLLEGFLPLVLKSLIELNLACDRYISIYCDNYNQVGSNQMKIKLLRSVALQYLPELNALLETIERSMKLILDRYHDVLFKGMSQGVRGKTVNSNANTFEEISHSTSVYRDIFSLSEWKFLCELMTNNKT